MSRGVYNRELPEETRRRLKELDNLLSCSFEDKIAMSEKIIKNGMERGFAALLYSGGRDSTVLLSLMKRREREVIVIHNNTTLGDPKNLDFIRKTVSGMKYFETKASPWEMWSERKHFPIFPKRGFTKMRDRYPECVFSPVQCCYQNKEKYSNSLFKKNNIGVTFWGNRAAEGNRRKLAFVDNGFIFKPKKYPWWNCYPLQHWTDADIDRYLEKFFPEYPRHKNYECGCLCCGIDWGYYPNNLSKLFKNDPEKWEKCMNTDYGRMLAKINGLDETRIKEIIREKPELLTRYRYARKGRK